MPLTLLTGPANAGKARAFLDGCRGDRERGGEPLLIVPTREDVERYRRELAASSVALGVSVGRFDELIEEVVARARTSGEAPGGFAREAALEAIASREAAQPAAPGYARELRGLIDELRERRVSGARLRTAAAK